jgi:hypothetical protein
MSNIAPQIRPPPLPLHRSKDIKSVKERLEELNKRYLDTFEVQKRLNRQMRDKFAERVYKVVDDEGDRIRLMKGFLLEYVSKEEGKDEMMKQEESSYISESLN